MPGYRKLGRPTAHRKAMLRNLVTDLFREGRISTTDCRAKEARREAEKLITLAKRGDLHARRQVLAYIYDESVVRKSLLNMLRETADIPESSSWDLAEATALRWYSSSSFNKEFNKACRLRAR